MRSFATGSEDDEYPCPDFWQTCRGLPTMKSAFAFAVVWVVLMTQAILQLGCSPSEKASQASLTEQKKTEAGRDAKRIQR